MGETEIASTPAALAVAGALAACILAALVLLVWGLAQRGVKNAHRVAEDWGGQEARVVEWDGKVGYVRAGGEMWKAVSEERLAPGDSVEVARMQGLLLEVRKK